uniref:Uncharacterized protein n=1 Tax=Vombatus ursinus TaxID=29139 RepID=A0A4X2M0M0_VOMUR
MATGDLLLPPPPTCRRRRKSEGTQEVATSECYSKYPLQNRWPLWFWKNDKSKTWQVNLQQISKFDTVRDFWPLDSHRCCNAFLGSHSKTTVMTYTELL